MTDAATLAMPMSIAERGLKREKALPLRGDGAGTRMVVKISPGVRTVRPGPVMHASTGIARVPLADAISIVAPSATSGGTLSADGDALPMLPPIVARLRSCTPATTRAASTSAG